MIRSLRKGQSSLYIQHVYTGHNLGAEKFECEIKNRKAILRLSIRPVDQNQRIDERYLHEEELVSITVDDSTVINGLLDHFNAHLKEIDSWELQLVSQGKTLSFKVLPELTDYNTLQVLKLIVDGQTVRERL